MNDHRCIECNKFGTDECPYPDGDQSDEQCEEFEGDDDE